MSYTFCMAEPQSFRDIIAIWPTRGDLAREISVPIGTARQMYTRNSIARWYWPKVVAAAAERERPDITEALLTKLATAKREEAA